MTTAIDKSKWDGFPIYDRPLGTVTEGIDDGREIVTITDFSTCTPAEHRVFSASVCDMICRGCYHIPHQ